MDPRVIGAMIPVVAIAGFFAWMIVRTLTKARVERPGGADARHEEVLAALEQLRREVAELAERVDFAERLLAQQRESERLSPPREVGRKPS
jgi:transcriptional regulator GlxA family with amidase domain